MATYYAGTVDANIGDFVSAIQGLVRTLKYYSEPSTGVFEFRMDTNYRANGTSLSQDLTEYDRFKIQIDENAGDLRVSAMTLSQTLTFVAGRKYHFISDGDADHSASYIMILVENAAETSIEYSLMQGLSVRCLWGLTHTRRVAYDINPTSIMLPLHSTIPTQWSNELLRKGSLTLSIIEEDGSLYEEFTVTNISSANPPVLTISPALSNTYSAGALVGKMPYNIFQFSRATAESYMSGSVNLELMLPDPIPDIVGNYEDGYLKATGIQIVEGTTWVSYGVPDVYPVNHPRFLHRGEHWVIGPDGNKKQKTMFFKGLRSNFSALVAIDAWSNI